MQSAEVEVTNDDPIPAITITGAQRVNEGASGTTDYDFTVNLTQTSADDIVVNFALGSQTDTATINDDYTLGNATNSLTFPAGTTGPQTINIDVVGDELYEVDESFTITLSLPTGATGVTLPQNPVVTGTITSDDTTLPIVSIADASAIEGSAGANSAVVFNVSLTDASGNPVASGIPVKVNYSTTDGTATTPETGADFLEVTNGELIIPASSSSVVNSGGTISITTYGDGTIEPDETFTVTLSLPSDANAVFPVDPDNDPARFTTITATGTILDDDTVAALTIADVTTVVAESTGSVDFVVTSTVPRNLTVHYQAAEVNSGDFLHDSNGQEDATTAVLNFTQQDGPGSYVHTLTVPIDNDGDGESNRANHGDFISRNWRCTTTYTVPTDGNESATATILDDDAP